MTRPMDSPLLSLPAKDKTHQHKINKEFLFVLFLGSAFQSLGEMFLPVSSEWANEDEKKES